VSKGSPWAGLRLARFIAKRPRWWRAYQVAHPVRAAWLRTPYRTVAWLVTADYWKASQLGLVRVLRWFAAVAIVAVTWHHGNPKSALDVIYPLVLAGLCFAPDIAEITFRGAGLRLRDKLDDVLQELAGNYLAGQAARSSKTEKESVTLDDLLRELSR
jgi:hypothetical protein